MKTIELLRLSPVIAVIVIDRVAHAVPMARALVKGGVRVLEVTLRTPAALDAVHAIAEEIEGAIVGVGTVTTGRDFRRSQRAGAAFCVSPGLTPELASAARDHDLPLLPGVMTPSELMSARAAGFTALKLFPAQCAGGVGMLQALQGPFPEMVFCPTGGITPESAPHFLALPNVACVGGSWLTPPELMHAGDWQRVTALARAASALRGPS
ncbi:MAG TPA: bifunctional 4-hydroxy-2-oxoglutarate aldolase/2-dehydro-3-deoxy-phosphogluconate aldolase [Burkholderiaceae bacterium]